MQCPNLERGRSRSLLFSVLCALALCAGPARADKVALTSPAWLRDGVIYELYPRNFSKEGTFNAATARLDDLKQAGVTILWIMPVHPIGEKLRKGHLGSPYAVKDYYAINPDYGDEADLKRLVSEAHARGLKVILDTVPNHTAWDCVLMAHPDFYKQDAQGNIIPPQPSWSDVAGLNYNNPALRQYMITMLKHWIDPSGFDFDGFRCDVASEVPTSFWEEARVELLKTKPDIMMLAEASKPELMVKAFDIDYSWPLLSALNRVLLDGSPASELQHTWEESRRQFPEGTLHMRMSDDHDEPRAISRFGIHGALAASALMFTLDGVPLLYNGMEVGDATESGDPALFEKLPVFWHPKDRPDLGAVYRSLAGLRKQYPVFRGDCVKWLPSSDAANLVTFMRADLKDEFVIVINFSNRPEKASVDVPHAPEFKAMQIDGMPAPVGDGLASLQLHGFDWRIYHRTLLPEASAKLTSDASPLGK
ncbi:MAG TPA: alpha-amylase family glycosyl hydrolase [Verrucomicrobiae bacterium]|jgi:glycosidase|nr:alpha-amylase family glycosyl hydrolase [Verrucomicrobiae bacterium]